LPNANEHNEKYWIPLTKLVQGEAENTDIHWLFDQDETMDMPASDKWVLFNNNNAGEEN